MEHNGGRDRPTVVVVGGGYGGAVTASEVDDFADVVLVEPKDRFLHNVASLRALVDPSWLPRIFMPYDGLLARGRIVRDRAVVVDPGLVITESGKEIAADYVVVATGSSYPFPAKTELTKAADAQEQVRAAHAALLEADRVLLVGAGPVGVELAGEIHAMWPEKSITLVDLADDVLGSRFKPELRAEVRCQLEGLGVALQLGSSLVADPSILPGERGRVVVTTRSGTDVEADIWFRCHGVVPNSSCLGPVLESARRPDGFVAVGPTLQVVGQQRVFAVGDVSTADDGKLGGFAQIQARTVAANIAILMDGGSDLEHYRSPGAALVLPIGPEGGTGQVPGQDGLLPPAVVAEMKGRDMAIEGFLRLFGLATTAPT